MLNIRLSRYIQLYPMLGLLGVCAQAVNIVTVCNSSIYCSGDLLHTVQLARIFPDSKTFVDLRLIRSEAETLTAFKKLMKETSNNPSRKQIMTFVEKNFEDKNELYNWSPPDFDPTPPILDKIVDPKLRQFAKDIISMWPGLGRIVSSDVALYPSHYSFIYVPNGFIVPGGRFKELYYWDSYWIIRGLLISNMTKTAKGMIENLLHLVQNLGYVPNGSRVYYLGRSQPPLLSLMVFNYFSVTGDTAWLAENIDTVEMELRYWLKKKKIIVNVKGKKYALIRFASDKDDKGPRPESYYKDYNISRQIPEDLRQNFYMEMRSIAESGWDFSSRWLVKPQDHNKFNRTDLRTSRILPVDLNAFFARALQIVGDFRLQLNDTSNAQQWWSLAKYWRYAIDNVMWDDEDGVWYDYDIDRGLPIKHFYPSCVAPLWSKVVETDVVPVKAARLVKYLFSSNALNFPGGVPTSLWDTGEQWDYPNAWPPLQSIMIGGLEESRYPEAEMLAKELAVVWIRANYIGYKKWQKMFEKYSCMEPGEQGSGGEYEVQDGFGWTNGIALELLLKYGNVLKVSENDKLPSVTMEHI